MAPKICAKIDNAFEGLVEEYGGTDLLDQYKGMTKEQKMTLADNIFEEMKTNIRQTKLTASALDFWETHFKTQQSKVEVKAKTKFKWRSKERQAKARAEFIAEDKAKVFVDMMSGHGIRNRGMISLERLHESILQEFEARIHKGLEKYRVRKFGLVHSKEGQKNVIHELYRAGSTGDKDAADLAKTFGEANEYLKRSFNNAGGNIKELEDYILPQFHDKTRIGRAKKEDWVTFVKDRVDLNRLIYHGAPGAVVPEKVVDELLGRVFDNLRSGGVLHKEISVNPHIRRMVGANHQEHRLLHFKDADSWIDYADKFGAIDYVQSLHSHAEIMSKEIAAMKLFGPNPDNMVRTLRRKVQKASADVNAGSLGESTYEQIMGRLYTNNTRIADAMRGIRNASVGLKIGKAVISAISDNHFFGHTSFFNGLPVVKGFGRVLGGLVNNKSQRMLAAQLHLGARYAIDNAKSAHRISEVIGVGGTAKFADFTVRASGLNYWTNVVRNSYGLNTLGHLGSLTDRQYINLNPKIRQMFKRYGISSSDWDRMRSAPTMDHEGVRYLHPGNFGDEELTHKMVGAIGEETDFAVPEPNAKVMAIARGKSQPGTLSGELARTAFTFKSFATSVIMSHWMRALNQTGYSRVGYFVSLITGTTVLGAVALQAKRLVDGKTPMDSTNRSFWAAAFLQGGGTGILGDFLFQDHTRMGSVAEFIGGPLMTDTSTLLGLVFGSESDFMQSRDNIARKAGKRTARAIDRLFPNLWQTNLIAKRYLTDHIQQMLNPNWASEQRSMQRRMSQKQGSKFWWKPGEPLPEGLR